MNSLVRRATLPFFWTVTLSVFFAATGQAQALHSARSIGADSGFGANADETVAPTPHASDPAAPDLPVAPEPAAASADEPSEVPWAATTHQQPFSRMSIGADVSPLGIGIKSAVLLTQYFDARMLFNFFSYDTGQFEVEGYRVDANFHLASVGTMADWYPGNSIWRLSAGLMLYNGNRLSAKSVIVPGTSFTVNGQDFYSASANPVTGATPVNGTGVFAMHRHQPAFMVSGGFGKFIPRSNRHWSFPSEFGVVFTGAPTIDVSTNGWVCEDKQQTRCANIADPTSPIAAQFNDALTTQVNKWRRSVSGVTVYPMFSYSVVYSFNLP